MLGGRVLYQECTHLGILRLVQLLFRPIQAELQQVVAQHLLCTLQHCSNLRNILCGLHKKAIAFPHHSYTACAPRQSARIGLLCPTERPGNTRLAVIAAACMQQSPGKKNALLLDQKIVQPQETSFKSDQVCFVPGGRLFGWCLLEFVAQFGALLPLYRPCEASVLSGSPVEKAAM